MLGYIFIVSLLFYISSATYILDREIVPPVITLPLKNQIVLKDSKVSLVCKAIGTGPIRFTWLRGGKTLSENRMRFTVRSIPNGSVLRIDPVKSKDQEFACIANNVAGQSVPSEAHLTVLTSLPRDFINGYPRIVVHPQLRIAEKGRDVTLACKAEGDNVTIEWYKDYVPLDVNNDERLNILPGGTLHIQRSETSDEGLYECLAENDIGVAYSYGAMLYVKVRRVPPYFSCYRESDRIVVSPGDAISLTCTAKGSPLPDVKWMDGVKELGSSVTGINVLRLEDVRESKNFTCVASSSLGYISRVVGVVVNDRLRNV